MPKELDVAGFADILKTNADVKRLLGACLVELRAIRISLADGDDSASAKKEQGKAEASTTEALATDGVGGGLAVLENVLADQFKTMGFDPTKFTPGSPEEAAMKTLMQSKLAELGAAKPAPSSPAPDPNKWTPS